MNESLHCPFPPRRVEFTTSCVCCHWCTNLQQIWNYCVDIMGMNINWVNESTDAHISSLVCHFSDGLHKHGTWSYSRAGLQTDTLDAFLYSHVSFLNPEQSFIVLYINSSTMLHFAFSHLYFSALSVFMRAELNARSRVGCILKILAAAAAYD